MSIAQELGYLDVPDGVIIDIDMLNRYPKEKVVLITTGSQGEPMSALARMANSDHRKVEVGPGDFIIISALSLIHISLPIAKMFSKCILESAPKTFHDRIIVRIAGS